MRAWAAYPRGGAWALGRLMPLLGAFLVVWAVAGPGGPPVGDEGPFLRAAHRILDGHYAVLHTTDATRFLWHGPGLPALISPLVALGVPQWVLRLSGPLLLFAAVLLFYRLLRLRLPRRGALIGAYALGLYAPAYAVIATLHKEPLALLMAVGALYATTRYIDEGRRRHLAAAGLALGGLVMTRLEYGWVLVALLAVGLVQWCVVRLRHGPGSDRARTSGRWAMVCAAGAAACVPWLAYTYSLTHHLLYWGSSGGMSLYWMSSVSPHQLGEWHAVHSVFGDPRLSGYRHLFNHLATLSPLDRDLELRHLAVTQALGHPAKYALNLLANLSRLLLGFPFDFRPPTVVLAALALIHSLLLGGLVAAGRALARTRRALPPETVPFLLFAALAVAVHLLPSAEPRMLVPIIPVPLWLIAQALARPRGRRFAANPAPGSRGDAELVASPAQPVL